MKRPEQKNVSGADMLDMAMSGLECLKSLALGTGMASNYEERLVANDVLPNGGIIDTCFVDDTRCFETALKDERYYGGWIIISEYRTRDEAEKDHAEWVKVFTDDPPATIIDVHGAGEFTRKD